jgi:PTH1 family peptidyl-tRNA hydrolase
LGKLKINRGNGANGHNGVISVQQCLGRNDFLKFRIGVDTRIGREIPGLEFVLQPFPESEHARRDQAVSQAAEAVRLCLEQGVEPTMGQYNKKSE